ncbi:MAG: Ig-like domain-containing protein [Limisphaerales bacterium]
MKKVNAQILTAILARAVLGAVLVLAIPAHAVDLLQHYPTKLTAGILQPEQARPWQFSQNDVYRLSRFHFEVGNQLKAEAGPADLGIGHCIDGAVWAVVIPTSSGTLARAGGSGEQIAHIWLRFHPAQINQIFPPDTVAAGAGPDAASQMRAIAGMKFRASYHAGVNAMIPEPKDMTLDVDTKAGVRRFFIVDTQAGTAEYASAFERQAVRVPARKSSGGAPKVLMSKPANGATDVDPGLAEITVTFDQEMSDGMSWTGGGAESPPSPDGAKAEWRGKRTCVLPVKLESGHHYRVGINSPSYRNFCSASGDPVEPTSISFTTK